MGGPQDIEWSIDPALPSPQNVFLLQTRPAKVAVKKAPEKLELHSADEAIDVMLKGLFGK